MVSHNRPELEVACSDLSMKSKKVRTLGGDCENVTVALVQHRGVYQPLTQGLERSSAT